MLWGSALNLYDQWWSSYVLINIDWSRCSSIGWLHGTGESLVLNSFVFCQLPMFSNSISNSYGNTMENLDSWFFNFIIAQVLLVLLLQLLLPLLMPWILLSLVYWMNSRVRIIALMLKCRRILVKLECDSLRFPPIRYWCCKLHPHWTLQFAFLHACTVLEAPRHAAHSICSL